MIFVRSRYFYYRDGITASKKSCWAVEKKFTKKETFENSKLLINKFLYN